MKNSGSPSQPIPEAVLSRHGELLAMTGVNGPVLLFDAFNRRILHELGVAESQPRHLAFSPDGRLLAVGHADGRVSLWEVAMGVLKATWRAHARGRVRVAFAPHGTLLATATNAKREIILWQVATGNPVTVLQGHEGDHALVFSPDSSLLAAGGSENLVSVWEVASGRELAVLRGHRGDVIGLAFSPDGQTLATLDTNRTVELWHVPTWRQLFTLLRSERPLRWLQFVSSRRLLVGTSGDARVGSDVFVFDAGEPAAPR